MAFVAAPPVEQPPPPNCLASVVSTLETPPDTRGHSWAVVVRGEVCGLWFKVRVMSEISPADGFELQ